MIAGWTLSIILSATVGSADAATFDGKKPYPSLGACIAAAMVTMNWLTQDFVKVKATCTSTDGSQAILVQRGMPA